MKAVITSVGDIELINWSRVGEQIRDYAAKKIVEVMDQAAAELKALQPGERRKFVIEIGTVEISRELDELTAKTEIGQ